jgi:hypothetical protein
MIVKQLAKQQMKDKNNKNREKIEVIKVEFAVYKLL